MRGELGAAGCRRMRGVGQAARGAAGPRVGWGAVRPMLPQGGGASARTPEQSCGTVGEAHLPAVCPSSAAG